MTSAPDWLAERVALDEVPRASRDRVAGLDPRALADQVSALRAANAAELTRHPAEPAVAQITAQLAAETKRRAQAAIARRRRWQRVVALSAGALAAVVVVVSVRLGAPRATDGARGPGSSQAPGELNRVKGATRLLAFRQVGRDSERLAADAVVRAGDVLQLRYHAGGRGYGVIASLDGAGAVTLHFPARDDAPPEATAIRPETTTLPDAYALDDAPDFERFFFLTSDRPIDVAQALASLRALAQHPDSDAAALALPDGLHQWSLRLRKAARSPQHEAHEAP